MKSPLIPLLLPVLLIIPAAVFAGEPFQIVSVGSSYHEGSIATCLNPVTGDVLVYYAVMVHKYPYDDVSLYAILLSKNKDNSFTPGTPKLLTSGNFDLADYRACYSEAANAFMIVWSEQDDSNTIYKATYLTAAGKWYKKPQWIFNSVSTYVETVIPVSVAGNNGSAPKGSIFGLVCFVMRGDSVDDSFAIYFYNSKLKASGKPVRFNNTDPWNYSLLNAHVTPDGGYLVYSLEENYYDLEPTPYVIKLNAGGYNQKKSAVTPNELFDYTMPVTRMKSGNYFATWSESFGHGMWGRMIAADGKPLGIPVWITKRYYKQLDSVTTDNGVTYLLFFEDYMDYKDRNLYVSKVKKTGKATKLNVHPLSETISPYFSYKADPWFDAVAIRDSKSYLLVTYENDGSILGHIYP